MFKFGENWASFSKQINEIRLAEAKKSLSELFGEGALKDVSFLDIGCGSGLFSIAAAQSGAPTVRGIDIDPVSVQVSIENAGRWLNGQGDILFQQISALDESRMESLGKFDVVYSWGVLHHSGDMSTALTNAAHAVKPGGLFMIAIYNRHWSSPFWTPIKWLYNHVGVFGQKLMIWILTPIILGAKWLVNFKNPLKIRRGMDFMHNIIDWVGGYPYEYAGVREMTERLQKLGFEMLLVRPAGMPTGCNEFVCRLVEKRN